MVMSMILIENFVNKHEIFNYFVTMETLIDFDWTTVAAEYTQIHNMNAVGRENTEETNDSSTALFLYPEIAMLNSSHYLSMLGNLFLPVRYSQHEFNEYRIQIERGLV